MKTLDNQKKKLLHEGLAIPAHPLALDEYRKLDEFHQRALTRYYLAAGVGGLAVGVHTTQFAIRDPKVNLYETVLALAAEEVGKSGKEESVIKVAGVSGPTDQAVAEAEKAAGLGYDLALVSVNGLGDWTEEALLERAQEIGKVMPLFGFYLQPAVGGRLLGFDFWKAFADLPNTFAIKMAPFNRYQTIDVVRAVCHSERNEEVALYTGNDDNIVNDLVTTYKVEVRGVEVSKQIVGGLLGHWAVWTKKAVELVEKARKWRNMPDLPASVLTENIAVTDSNAAFFDARNNFQGCIAGLHEVLVRQGLMKGLWCLDPEEGLSPGQLEEINRVYAEYPELNDDAFVAEHLEELMRG